MQSRGSRWVLILALGLAVVALSVQHAATQGKKGGAPKPRGNVTRKVDLEGPSGHRVVVSLTVDRQLDKRVLDYLAATLQVVDSGMSSAERAEWAARPGPDTMGWPITVAIASRDGRDVSTYLVRPPPGVDLIRPDVLWPTEALLAGLLEHPRVPFPERVVPATTAAAHGGPPVTITGTIACAASSGIADVEVSVEGIAAAWSGTSFAVTGPIPAGPARVTVRYRGRVGAAGVSTPFEIVDDGGWTRTENTTATVALTGTTGTIAITLPATDCEAWRHGHFVLTDHMTIAGAPPPAGRLTIRRQAGVWATAASTPAAYAHYDTIVLPTTWLTTYPDEHRRVIFHEFAHTIQHVADGSFHHWNGDLLRYSYGRFWEPCGLTNRAFAFNEGWAIYWAKVRGNGGPSCPSTSSVLADWNLKLVADQLDRLDDALGGDDNVRAAGMRAVLIGAPGTIHTLRDFERRYCQLHPTANPNCADFGAPVRAAPAACPPEFTETAHHCHRTQVVPKEQRPRGAASTPTGCVAGFELLAGLCYSACPAGFRGVGPVCWQDCPAGHRDDGAYCAKPAPFWRGPGYGWQLGDAAWSLDGANQRCAADHPGGCEQHGAIIYPRCQGGFHAVGCCVCSPDCQLGMTDVGISCQKQAQGRQITSPTQCAAGKVYDTGLCYPPCAAGFVGLAGTCWKTTCPTGFADHGATCYRPPLVLLKV